MEENTEITEIVTDISYSIDSVKLNNVYHVIIDNIYDPSKFWLMIHIKERQLFEQYLTNYYKSKKILMSEFHIQKYATCIVSRNYVYYRATILPVLLHDRTKVRVFLIDYGQTINVELEHIFYIFKEHKAVPRFAIRATLAEIVPFNCREPWTLADLQEFLKLTSGKQLLAKITEIDSQEKVLHVTLFGVSDSTVVSINDKMIEKGIASRGTWIRNSNYKTSKYRRKMKYMHLIPTFYALENGTVPSSLWEQNILKEVPLDLLHKSYYEYQNINCSIYDSF